MTDDFTRWRSEPASFIEEALHDPETGKPFVLNDAQRAFVELALERDEDGRLKYPELLFAAPKKSGKTALGAMIIIVIVVVLVGPHAEAVIVANDLEQAQGRVFTACRRIVEASPLLAGSVICTGSKIIFPELKASIIAIASDATGAAGSNSNVTAFDELWGAVSERSRRLFDECVPPPTRQIACRLTTTYAGFEGESDLLEDLYKRGLKQPLVADSLHAGDGMLMAWHHKPIAPWQTPAWLGQMRQQLRPNAYLRLIENRFVSSESTFVEMDWYDRCVTLAAPVLADKNLPVWIGVDASVKHDATGIVAVTMTGSRVRVVSHRIFQPSPDRPLDFEETIERTVLDMCSRFTVRGVHFDPYQMQSVAQRLAAAGVPMREYPQTVANLTSMGNNLFELIKCCGIEFYQSNDIRLAISRTIAIETPRGIRLAKEKSSHKIDVVIALAMAAEAAVNWLQKPTIPVQIFVGLPTGSHEPIDDPDAHYESALAAASRGELRGASLAWFYRERQRRGGMRA